MVKLYIIKERNGTKGIIEFYNTPHHIEIDNEETKYFSSSYTFAISLKCTGSKAII